MKQTIFNQKNLKIIALICSFTFVSIASATSSITGKTTPGNSVQEHLFALQIVEPVIVLNKQMIKTVKLAAFDNMYGRVDIALTAKASELLSTTGILKKNQKMVFTINNQISDALVIQGTTENLFSLSITTSRKNADLIVKSFS